MGGTYGVLFAAEVVSDEERVLGTVMLLADFGPIAGLLVNPRGLGETWRSVGWGRQRRYHSSHLASAHFGRQWLRWRRASCRP